MVGLEKVRSDIYECYRCGHCRETVSPSTSSRLSCPVREELGFDHYDARGRVLVARAILEGKLGYSDKLVESVYTCTACGLCKEVCPVGAITGEPRQLHAIDTAKCVKCGNCRGKCPVGAIALE